ncbi:Interferon-related developmental regulator family protein [Giardia muris]|uniref:Interferon-related developmental regulator family protein n=1 Tax=Giardia muris TaxID=5742 RepID=A0A4Z1SX27_GIAMU|nr:Interferon-related developmental regulator family protein [Giardia muris]|eukprot:TNJ30294.1 Interferon-related developmental regulator family protein [Giardia muris]
MTTEDAIRLPEICELLEAKQPKVREQGLEGLQRAMVRNSTLTWVDNCGDLAYSFFRGLKMATGSQYCAFLGFLNRFFITDTEGTMIEALMSEAPSGFFSGLANDTPNEAEAIAGVYTLTTFILFAAPDEHTEKVVDLLTYAVESNRNDDVLAALFYCLAVLFTISPEYVRETWLDSKRMHRLHLLLTQPSTEVAEAIGHFILLLAAKGDDVWAQYLEDFREIAETSGKSVARGTSGSLRSIFSTYVDELTTRKFTKVQLTLMRHDSISIKSRGMYARYRFVQLALGVFSDKDGIIAGNNSVRDFLGLEAAASINVREDGVLVEALRSEQERELRQAEKRNRKARANGRR